MSRRKLSKASALCVLLVSGCGSSPTAPSPSPSFSPTPAPPTPPAVTPYRVTGVVTDEAGTPLSGLPLHFECRCPSANSYFTISTDAAGRYEVLLNTVPVSFYGSSIAIALVHTWREGYQVNVQLLPFGPTDIVQNIRLRRSRVVRAGESFTSIVEPHSSMCTDLEDLFVWTHRCERIVIATESTGTLVVDGREGAGGAPLPYIFFQTTGNYTTTQDVGTGVVSVGVTSGQKYTVLVGAPVGMPGLNYEVKTFITQDR